MNTIYAKWASQFHASNCLIFLYITCSFLITFPLVSSGSRSHDHSIKAPRKLCMFEEIVVVCTPFYLSLHTVHMFSMGCLSVCLSVGIGNTQSKKRVETQMPCTDEIQQGLPWQTSKPSADRQKSINAMEPSAFAVYLKRAMRNVNCKEKETVAQDKRTYFF